MSDELLNRPPDPPGDRARSQEGIQRGRLDGGAMSDEEIRRAVVLITDEGIRYEFDEAVLEVGERDPETGNTPTTIKPIRGRVRYPNGFVVEIYDTSNLTFERPREEA